MEDFSKEMEYGNYLDFDRFPLDCESMAMMQSTLRHYAAIAQIAGYDLLILSGCEESGGYRGEGYVFVKKNGTLTGEILFHPKAVQQSTCSISEVKYDVQADGETFENAYSKRRLVEGGNEFSWSEVVNLSSVSNKALFSKLYSLSNSLSSEQSAREAAVQSLKETLLQQIRSEVILSSGRASSSLSTEVTALNKRIADLESALSAQIANAQNTADTAADGLASTQFVNSQISTLTDKINTEITQRTADDNTEKAERTAADKTITARVDNIEKYIVPKGVILMWSGSSDTIPAGWALCDGQYGTPNLVGRFVLGATQGILDENGVMRPSLLSDSDVDVLQGIPGGSKDATISLTVENLPPHTHTATSTIKGYKTQEKGSDDQIWVLDNGTDVLLDSTDFTVNTKISYTGGGYPYIINTMPPYYALCYIMKL